MKPQDEMWREVCEKLLGITLTRFDEAVPSDKQNIPYQLYYSGKYHHTANLPPLTLDALHEAEEKLKAKGETEKSSAFRDCWTRYQLRLADIVHGKSLWDNGTFLGSFWDMLDALHATKEQRLLALWRTISA